MRRTARVALFLVLVMAVTVSPVVTRAAQSRIPSNVAADFDGDGVADLAVGVPGENAAAGAVNVLYGTGGGLSGTGSQLFDQVGSAVEQLDTFGSALAAGDFNQDGFPDLAAAAPQEDIGGDLNAGTVSVLHGSAAGLTASGGRLFTQVGGRDERFDVFGFALAAGDFNADGSADLAAGAPGETVGSSFAAGAVSTLNGSAAGLTTSGGRLFTQVGGRVEVEDQFGAQLAAGDFNDNGSADLAAAAPNEDLGSIRDAGAVSVLQGSAGGLTASGGRLFTQASPGVVGAAEPNDNFGGWQWVP